MLTDEQLAVLPVRASVQADVARMVLSGGIYGDKDLASEISYMAGELADALLACQCDRDRCKRAGRLAQGWWNKWEDAESRVKDHGDDLFDLAVDLGRARRWSAAWKAAAKKWRAAFNIRRDALVALSKERDELQVKVALLTRAAGELFEDVMSRHPEIRDTGFRCQYMGNLYEAVQCLNADATDVLKKRDALRRRLEEAQKTFDWLWGFWDGNSLVAQSGYDDDIQNAFEKLAAALASGKEGE